MTKILSQLLGGQEPDFRLGLARLEKASGNGNHDIRLTSEVIAAARLKLRELGLDPRDTSGEELYNALAIKLVASDRELAKVLKLEPLEVSFLDDFAASASKLTAGNDCFAMKSGVAKRLIRANPPKRAMKALGYRSLESFLKHESIAGIFMAMRIYESDTWHKLLAKSYHKLRPSDFESKKVTISALSGDRWNKLAADFTTRSGHNVFVFNEIGVVAALPLSSYPSGVLTAMLLLTLDSVNDVLASSSYLKLNQVKPNFGLVVAHQAAEPPQVAGPLDDHHMNWRTVHDFIAGSAVDLEPQLSADSQVLLAPADVLASLSPALEFWHGTSHLAYVNDGQPVSLNPLDVAINHINNLPFDRRQVNRFRANLWAKLWQHYLQAEVLAEKLVDNLRRELSGQELAPDLALVDGSSD